MESDDKLSYNTAALRVSRILARVPNLASWCEILIKHSSFMARNMERKATL